MNKNQFDLLKTPRFLPLFITQFLGAFNDNVFKNAFVILITYRLAKMAGLNAQVLVTFAAGVFIFPFFPLSATAGQLADKYEKSQFISILKFVEILLMLLAALGFYLGNISILMLVLGALGVQATFFGPLKYAILPDHLHEDELIAGNGLIEAGTFLAILFGTILGGVLILHPHGEFLISIVVFTVAIGGLLSSFFIPKTQSNPQLNIRYNIVKETFQLLRYSKDRPDIFLSILGISWFWLIGATFLAELPVFAKDVLGANQSIVTFFLALFSIGIGIGSLLCNRLLKGKVYATYVPLGAIGITLFTVDLYVATSHITVLSSNALLGLGQLLHTFTMWRITFDLLLIAICGGLYTVPLYAILQHRSEKEHRARVIASNNVMNALFMVFAATATMLMLKIGFSVTAVFLTVAIANGAVAIYICKLLPDIVVKAFFRWLLTILYRVKIKGLENYKHAGKRVVIIANHTSLIDAVLLAAFLPDKLTFVINTITAKKWWIRLFLHMVNTYPMDPTNPMSLKSLIEFVQQNKKCVIFPEGRLTMTGALMKIYEGPGLVADKSAAKLLPIRIQGAQLTPFSRLKGKVRIRWMPKITITIFPPQEMNVSPEIKGRNRRQQISSKLYDVMTEMMFESNDYHQTLFTSLIDARKMHGRHHEIAEDIERSPITYQQVITRCFILGNIITRTTEPGEYVGVLLPNMISNAILFFALQAYCRVPAMLNFSMGMHHVVSGCQAANIKTVYTSRKFIGLAKLSAIVNKLDEMGLHIIYLEDLRTLISFWNKLKGMLMAQCPQIAYRLINISKTSQPRIDSEAPAVVLFTSGTEGIPKGVVLSHTNVQANRFQLSACVDFTATDKVFNALPIFHSFGLTSGMLLPLLSGVSVFLYPSPLHYRIIPELSYDINATILFGTDTFLSGYAKYAHPYNFYSVRYVFAGAEKLREETYSAWSKKFGIRIFEGYGTTETSPVLATNTPLQHKAGTVGRLLPGIQYKLNHVPGVTDGGVLVVRGPNVMKGYLFASQPGVIIAPKDGWYETGDIISIDESGFLTIKGRINRFAKIGGEMISLGMIEQQINTLWPNYQHAIINVPDPKKGEQVILVTTYLQAVREEMIAFFRANGISEIAIPKKILTIQKMFLLGAGKINYTEVKEFALKNL